MNIKKLVKSLESCPVGDGDKVGEPFKVLPYQKKCWQPAKMAHFETREIRGCFEVWRAP